MNHPYNTSQDHRNIPIANLIDIQPVSAPSDKVYSLDLVSGSSDHDPSKQQGPVIVDLEKAVAVPTEESPPRSCGQRVKSAIRARPGFVPWVVGSGIAILGSWKNVARYSGFIDEIVGFNVKRRNLAYHNIFNATAQHVEQHQQCIIAQADTCIANFDLAHDLERSALNDVYTSNQVQLNETSLQTGHCIMSLYDIQAALRELVLSGGTPPFVESNAVCSAADKAILHAIAGGELRNGQNEILNLVQLMTAESETQAEYLKDLAIYNRDYFFGRLALLEADLLLEIGELVDVSLQGLILMRVTGVNAFNGIIACVSTSEGSARLCSFPATSVSLQRVYNTAEAIIGIGGEQLELAAMVIATLVDRYDWAVGSIQEFVRIFEGIRSVLGRPFDLAIERFGGIDLGQFSNIAPGAFYVPGALDFPEFPDLPPIEPILDDLTWEIAKLREQVSSVAAQVSDELGEKVQELVTKIRGAFGDVLHDYDPPKPPGFNTFNVQEISNSFSSRRQELADLVAAEVGKLSLGDRHISEPNFYVPPTPDVDFNSTSARVNEASAAFQHYPLPDFYEVIENVVKFIFNHFYILDWVRIVWGIMNKFRKMWEKSAVAVPFVRMPLPRVQESEEQPFGRWWKVLSFGTHDSWKKIVPWLFGIGLVSVVVSLYILIYGHFHSNCVTSLNGTWLGREWLATLRYNTLLPRILRTDGAQRSRVVMQHQSKCEEIRLVTELNQEQQQYHLDALENEYGLTMEESQRLLNCIDFDAWGVDDSDLSTCALPLDTQLDSGVAQCDWGECFIDCDQDALAVNIRQIVSENECIMEEQFHAWLWKFSAMICIWLCLAWLATLVQEFPPHLFPDTFGSRNVHLSYMRDRKTHEIIGGQGEDPDSAIAKAIARHFFWGKMKACAKMLCLLLCIAGLMTALIWFGRSGI